MYYQKSPLRIPYLVIADPRDKGRPNPLFFSTGWATLLGHLPPDIFSFLSSNCLINAARDAPSYSGYNINFLYEDDIEWYVNNSESSPLCVVLVETTQLSQLRRLKDRFENLIQKTEMSTHCNTMRAQRVASGEYLGSKIPQNRSKPKKIRRTADRAKLPE